MSSTIFIAAVVIACIILFVVLMKRGARQVAKKDTLKLMVAFDKLEARQEAQAATRELMHRRLIGIDRSKRILLFIDHTRSGQVVHAIDLNLVKEARILKDSNPLTSYTGSIFIECRFADTFSEPARLCFYDEYYDDVDSLAQIEKKAVCWQQTISIYKARAATGSDQMIKTVMR